MRYFWSIFLVVGTLPAQHSPVPRFSGTAALQATRAVTALGPRPSGSEAHRKLQALIVNRVQSYGCKVEKQPFTAQTPAGPLPMTNLIVRIPGRAATRSVVLTGHYDTKLMSGQQFVGANDGGSSTGFLLEMARVHCGRPRKQDLLLVWLDGEEAVQNWTANDSLYGSRYLAQVWQKNGTLPRVRALINIDMIGDGDLALVYEINSTAWLRTMFWDGAAKLGYSAHFPRLENAIEDDHIPFLRAGVAAVDLIDFDYGPGNSWWHTDRDTIDKLSAKSFQIVGNVVLHVLNLLEE
jgi:Zn-dependent M28 family amino/carboxypeptidase